MAELTRKNNSQKNHKTRKSIRPGRYNVHGLNFDIADTIAEYKENIAETLREAKPTKVKKEIILMIDNHGVDLPGNILDTNLTKQVRMCVSGSTGIPFANTGIYKDKLLDAFYETNFHKIGIAHRKKLVENIIKLHSAEYTKTYSYGRKGEELKRYYKQYQDALQHKFESDGLKIYLNLHVKHIKPVIDHKYSTGNFSGYSGCTDINRKSGVIDENIFGMFTIISTTEPEDQEYTFFGCCASDNKKHLNYSKATSNKRDTINYRKFDLIGSKYWRTKIKKPFDGYVIPKFIHLSNILTSLKEKYDNIYIIDNTCRSISQYIKDNPDVQINFKKMNLNELSKGSYSPNIREPSYLNEIKQMAAENKMRIPEKRESSENRGAAAD